jgi:hypothetical protein
VYARTLNSPLNITVFRSPIEGSVKVEALTANAPAHLDLDSAFEGKFSLTTANAIPVLVQPRYRDPTGRGRRRAVNVYGSDGTNITGEVQWVPGSVDRILSSSAWLTSVNAPVHLVL